MKQGKLTEALALLTDITNLNSDPRYWWHRAEVEFKIHETTADSSFLEAARKHYKIAQSLKLANQIFTPNEETRLANLEKNLAVPKPPAADTDALNPVQSSSSNQKHRLEDPAKLLVTT